MKRKLFWVLLVYVVVFVLLIGLIPRTINWNDFFVSSSKQPYGTHITKQLLTDIFTEVEDYDRALYTLVDESSDPENYIFVTSFFQVREDEQNALLDWISRGNNAFIAANDFSQDFLDTLNLESRYVYKGFDALQQSSLKVKSIQDVHDFSFTKQYNIYGVMNKHDSLASSFPLAVNISNDDYDNNLPIVIQREIGEGKLILSTLPYALTNYYMVRDNHYKFAQNMLSFMPNVKTYWDTYYKPQTTRVPPLKVFLDTKAFRWGGYLGLTLLLLHILFSIKRKQRIIPIVNPPENRGLEFTQTIGDLYHSTYDLHDLMQKMERYFKEFVREKYLISNYEGTPEQTEVLLAKSGKKIGLVSTINTYFRDYRNLQIVDEKSILNLSKKLQIFYDGR